ncbi:MAG: glycosyltransferase, partial [Candidatus Micrarchaeia archaeon]
MKKITLVVPAYNEEDRISRAASRFISSKTLSENCRFLFIVDGNDKTYRILEGIKQDNPGKEIQIKKYSKRLGKGGAVEEGIKAAKTDYVGFLDVDENLQENTIEKMMDVFLEKELDCLIGKRINSRRSSLFREIASKLFNIYVNVLFGIGISDTQCGCKFFKKKLVYSGAGEVFRIRGFAFDIELLEQVKNHGGKITEYRIENREYGGGKFSLWDSPKMFLDLLTLR